MGGKRDENPSLIWEKCIDKLCAVCYYFDTNNRLRKVKTTKQMVRCDGNMQESVVCSSENDSKSAMDQKMEGRAHG